MDRFRANAYALLSTILLGACGDGSRAATAPQETAPAMAALRSASSENGASVFIDLAGCGMFDGNGRIVAPLDAKVNVITNSANGNALHNCTAVVDNPTGRAIRYDADNNPLGIHLPCRIFDDAGNFVLTFTLHEQISASGQAHLICVANARRS
jgi:hypothetical protein